jgi:type IV fimbrial biogenesis protein FimT
MVAMKLSVMGFTLIESMISIAILVIISSLAPASLENIISKNLRASRTDNFYTAIQFTRNSAINEKAIMTLCMSNDGTVCDKSASKYLIVFNDLDNNKTATAVEIKQLLNISDKKTLISIKVSGGRNYIRFRPDGTAIDFGRIKICPSNKDNYYADELILNYGGRLRIADDIDNDGIVEGKDGANIIC